MLLYAEVERHIRIIGVENRGDAAFYKAWAKRLLPDKNYQEFARHIFFVYQTVRYTVDGYNQQKTNIHTLLYPSDVDEQKKFQISLFVHLDQDIWSDDHLQRENDKWSSHQQHQHQRKKHYHRSTRRSIENYIIPQLFKQLEAQGHPKGDLDQVLLLLYGLLQDTLFTRVPTQTTVTADLDSYLNAKSIDLDALFGTDSGAVRTALIKKLRSRDQLQQAEKAVDKWYQTRNLTLPTICCQTCKVHVLYSIRNI
jgi:hypothetical protein